MPLPAANTEWPPKELCRPWEDIDAWAAWWSGDPDALTAVYEGRTGTEERSFEPRGLRGAMTRVQRWFWGQLPSPGEQRNKLHVPLPAEIAQVSADLLFGEPPRIVVSNEDRASDGGKATQKRIDELLGEAVHIQLHDGAEAGAALGHSYLRVAWDKEVDPDGPILSVVDADGAYPRYQYGRLVEVTFVNEYDAGGGSILRHLENHTRGRIEHGLYLGDRTTLGRRVPLAEHPETAGLVPTGVIDTQLSRLAVVAVPNARARALHWRRSPQARDMGRADIAGAEQLLDALDDVWTSWMRDIRHGRSRIHVPQNYLQPLGLGKGARVDLDKELYVGLEAMTDGERLELTATQFKIRWQEHSATADALFERCVAEAGYSPQTFGLQGDSAVMNATESWALQVRTQHTRRAKSRRWRIGLVELTQLTMEVDRVHFKGKGDPALVPRVQFPENVAESLRSRAETTQMFAAAEAASTDTLVRMAHPDWPDDEVKAEVDRILDERAQVQERVTLRGRARTGVTDPDQPDDDDPPGDGQEGGAPRAQQRERLRGSPARRRQQARAPGP